MAAEYNMPDWSHCQQYEEYLAKSEKLNSSKAA